MTQFQASSVPPSAHRNDESALSVNLPTLKSIQPPAFQDVSAAACERPSTPQCPSTDLSGGASRSVVKLPSRSAKFSLESFAPPTVSETKSRFAELHSTPIPAVYSTVVIELLVQHHFMRYNKQYKYDPILEGFDSPSKDDIFKAYLKSLDQDPVRFRSDAASLETACSELPGGLEELLSEERSDSNLLKSSLMQIAQTGKNGEFFYTKFFAIGLFRVLEITGFKDPKALERLVTFLGANLEFVNRDLKLYKNILTRLSAAKEMMKEVTEREQKRAAEREASKATTESTTEPESQQSS